MMLAAVEIPILFAAGIDWLEAILPILFVGFWILSQVFAVLRRVGGGGRAQPPVVRLPDGPRRDAMPRVPPPAGEGDPRAVLEKQIADFLRQVTGEEPVTQKPPRPQPQQRPTPTTASPKPPASRPKSEKPARPKPAVPAAQAPRSVGTLAAGSSDVARHVQDAFAHDLGHLHSGLERATDEPAKVAPARPAARGLSARDLVAAARDPATIRQAILLREILERPVDRW